MALAGSSTFDGASSPEKHIPYTRASSFDFDDPSNKRKQHSQIPSMSHKSLCDLHDLPESNGNVLTRCNAKTKQGHRCKNKAKLASLLNTDILPVCASHQNVRLRKGLCQAIVACGRKCHKPFGPWEPPYQQLCNEHINDPRESCFMKLPTELRVMIYRYLLPNKEIGAHDRLSTISRAAQRANVRARLKSYRHDKFAIHVMPLLLINKTVHSDVMANLYGSVPVNVEIGSISIGMCTSKWSRQGWRDEVNKNPDAEHDWTKHMPSFDFNYIKRLSLRLTINAYDGASLERGELADLKCAEKMNLYRIRHHLREFVNHFLSATNQPLLSLNVHFQLNTYSHGRSPLSDTKIMEMFTKLIEPTRSFKRVIKEASITVKFSEEIFNHIADSDAFATFSQQWQDTVKASGLPPSPSWLSCNLLSRLPLAEAFQSLESVANAMIYHKVSSAPVEKLLIAACTAKEENNQRSFLEAKKKLQKLWDQYLAKQVEKKKRIKQAMRSLKATVSKVIKPENVMDED